MNFEYTVNEGVKLLDRHAPGWENQINTTDLDMYNPNTCMLGQLFGGFGVGVSQLGIEFGDTGECGFVIPDGVPEMFRRDAYDRLGETWRRVIQGRHIDQLSEFTQEIEAREAVTV